MFGSVHLQGILQESCLFSLNYFKEVAWDHHFLLEDVAKNTWSAWKMSQENSADMLVSCYSRGLQTQMGAECLTEPGEHLASVLHNLAFRIHPLNVNCHITQNVEVKWNNYL